MGISIELYPSEITKIKHFIKENNIKNQAGRLITQKEACENIIKDFIEINIDKWLKEDQFKWNQEKQAIVDKDNKTITKYTIRKRKQS